MLGVWVLVEATRDSKRLESRSRQPLLHALVLLVPVVVVVVMVRWLAYQKGEHMAASDAHLKAYASSQERASFFRGTSISHKPLTHKHAYTSTTDKATLSPKSCRRPAQSKAARGAYSAICNALFLRFSLLPRLKTIPPHTPLAHPKRRLKGAMARNGTASSVEARQAFLQLLMVSTPLPSLIFSCSNMEFIHLTNAPTLRNPTRAARS